MKNPMMTECVFAMAMRIKAMSEEQIKTLEKELAEDNPKSKLCYVIENLLATMRQNNMISN